MLHSVKRHSELLDRARKARDIAIVGAREEGATLVEIAAQAGLTHPGVKKIIDKHRSQLDSDG